MVAERPHRQCHCHCMSYTRYHCDSPHNLYGYHDNLHDTRASATPTTTKLIHISSNLNLHNAKTGRWPVPRLVIKQLRTAPQGQLTVAIVWQGAFSMLMVGYQRPGGVWQLAAVALHGNQPCDLDHERRTSWNSLPQITAFWDPTRHSANDNIPHPIDQRMNSWSLGTQGGNCNNFASAHSLTHGQDYMVQMGKILQVETIP